MKLQQPDLRRIYHNLEVIPSNFQIRGMHTILRDQNTNKTDFVFIADRLLRLVRTLHVSMHHCTLISLHVLLTSLVTSIAGFNGHGHAVPCRHQQLLSTCAACADHEQIHVIEQHLCGCCALLSP